MIPPFAQSKKRHTVILVALCGIVAGLLVVYAVCYSHIGKQTEALLALRTEEAAQSAQIRYQENLRSSVLNTKEEQARLDGYFVTATRVPVFLGMIEATGRGFGLTTETVSLGVTNNVLMVEVKASGSFANLVTLAAFLEKMPYKLRVVRATMGALETGHGWNGDFTLEVSSFE